MKPTEDLAKRLNGMQYGSHIPAETLDYAKDSGLVIVTGYSDDNVEFEGAFREEVGAYDGVVIMADRDGVIMGHDCGCEHCKEIERGVNAPFKIDAQWSQNGYSWYIETNIPNAAYFDVMEDDDKFCRGMVFALADLKEVVPVISTEQDLKTIEAMQTYGGSFVKALAAAATAADMYNLTKIKTAFPEYWAQYEEMAKS